MNFPTPIGGTLVREDFIPSILFAALYCCLLPFAAFRLFKKSSRTLLLLETVSFSIERVVIFSLRAVQSRNEEKAESRSLATYEQLTIGLGFIGICQSLVSFLRVLLVNTTRPVEREGGQIVTGVDLPQERSRYRQFSGYMSLAFLAAIVPGIISGSKFTSGMDNADVAEQVMNLRYASSGVTLFLAVTIWTAVLVLSLKRPRGNLLPAMILMSLATLLSIVGVYRLSVMHNKTISLSSREPGSLSSPSAKALFYVFHMMPEWLACALILCLNCRKIFNTGPLGDWKISDAETRWERKKREKREALLQANSINLKISKPLNV